MSTEILDGLRDQASIIAKFLKDMEAHGYDPAEFFVRLEEGVDCPLPVHNAYITQALNEFKSDAEFNNAANNVGEDEDNAS